MTEEIRILKLKTGELAIGKINYDELVAEQVHRIVPTENNRVAIIPYFHPLSKERNISIHLEDVLCHAEPVPEIIDSYNNVISIIKRPTKQEQSKILK